MRYNILLKLFKDDSQRELLEIIEYQQEELRVLKAQFDATGKRLLLTNEQRYRLASLAKQLGSKLPEIATLVTPDTRFGVSVG